MVYGEYLNEVLVIKGNLERRQTFKQVIKNMEFIPFNILTVR